ncbi:MAG: Glutamate synthase alpha subunit domain protein [Thermoanaerobacterales bacterium 50_218]|nr:MAG: Glutamate synthase alpha subunit domain protein [Thermoanaerobacterales bacterium 50_218]
MMITIDASGLHYRKLNEQIRKALATGATEILIKNANGQRYIGTGISGNQRIVIEGTPGSDLAAFMDGLEIEVMGNAQDGVGNTMNAGRVIVHGNAGDVTGYGMRGGELFIRGDVGYRVGIHMKAYKEKQPVIVIGGRAGAFLGEYMAGGVILLLGLDLEPGREIVGNFCGTGMHGGTIFIRGEVEPYKLGKEVRVVEPTSEDEQFIADYVARFASYFGDDLSRIVAKPFKKLIPFNKRPYGNLYTPY